MARPYRPPPSRGCRPPFASSRPGSLFPTVLLLLLLPTLLLPLLLPTPGAQAHFVLTYPKARGSDENLQSQAPCGGYNAVAEARVPFPTSGGFIQLVSAHSQATFAVKFAKSPSQTDFLPVEGTQSITSGTWNVSVGFAALKAQGVDVGTEGTLQVTYDGGDGTLYQCSDIVLTQSTNSTTTTSAAATPGPSPLLASFLVGLFVLAFAFL